MYVSRSVARHMFLIWVLRHCANSSRPHEGHRSSTPVLQDSARRVCAPAFVGARAGAHCIDVLARTGTEQGGTCATLCAVWNDAAPSCKPRPIALPAHAPTLAHLEDTVRSQEDADNRDGIQWALLQPYALHNSQWTLDICV